jgi:hypothetical protein
MVAQEITISHNKRSNHNTELLVTTDPVQQSMLQYKSDLSQPHPTAIQIEPL